MSESKKEEKKPKRMSSNRNLKEHHSLFKWIKDLYAGIEELKSDVDEMKGRVGAIERRARDNYFAWCYGKYRRLKTVAVCGGFDPLHIGHIRHFSDGKKLGNYLIVMLQTDDWLMKKKGCVFMPYDERKELIESIRYVDEVVPVVDKDMSVAETLAQIKPNIFAKGGDRTIKNIPKSEIDTCVKYGIEMVFGVGGEKIQSSSELIKKVRNPNA